MKLNALTLLAFVAAQDSVVLSDLAVLSSYGKSALSTIENWEGSTGVASSIWSNYIYQIEKVIGHWETLSVTPSEMDSYKAYVADIPDILAAIGDNLGALGTAASNPSWGLFQYYQQNWYLTEMIWNISPDCESWQTTFAPENSILSTEFASFSSHFPEYFTQAYSEFAVHTCSTTSSPASSATSTSKSTSSSTVRCFVRPPGGGDPIATSSMLA